MPFPDRSAILNTSEILFVFYPHEQNHVSNEAKIHQLLSILYF